MTAAENRRGFEEVVLPHLDAAYNLARWLTRSPDDAEDVVQEAYLRAFRYYAGFDGDDARSWLLTIVRNTCYTWLRNNRDRREVPLLEDDQNDRRRAWAPVAAPAAMIRKRSCCKVPTALFSTG